MLIMLVTFGHLMVLKCFVEMYMEYAASLLRYRYGTLKELNGCFLLKLTSNKNM